MITEQNDTTENTASTTTAERYQRSVGHQMDCLGNLLQWFESYGRFADDAAELRAAFQELEGAYAAVVEAELEGVDLTPEDEAAQALIAAELAAINRRLDMMLALADVRTAARSLGRAACRDESEESEDEAVEH